MGEPLPLLAPAPRTGLIAVPGRDPVPVTLLTGFLGAGKTTLLNRILTGDHGLRIAVLVNDFGAINVDAVVVESVGDTAISLANGCVCCEIRDDLATAIERLMAQTEKLDHIVLEASGVADPGGVVMTFLDSRYEQLLRIDAIICVVDAEGIFADDHDRALTALKLRQIGFADLVVLNKTDLVGPEHIAVIRDWIGLHLQRIRIVEAVHGAVPLEILLGGGRFDPARIGVMRMAGESARDAAPVFDRWSFRTGRLFSRDALERMVKRELPASVLRCKGIIYTDDAPDRARVLQVVGRRTAVADLGRDLPPGSASEIVVIGRAVDGDQLAGLFTACLRS